MSFPVASPGAFSQSPKEPAVPYPNVAATKGKTMSEPMSEPMSNRARRTMRVGKYVCTHGKSWLMSQVNKTKQNKKREGPTHTQPKQNNIKTEQNKTQLTKQPTK